MILYSAIWLIVLANAALAIDRNPATSRYELTPEEIQAFIALKTSVDPSFDSISTTKPSIHVDHYTGPPEGDEKAVDKRLGLKVVHPHQGTTLADCIYHNSDYDGFVYTYGWNSASCQLAVGSPIYYVNCSTSYTVKPNHVYHWHIAPTIWTHTCPKDTVCVDYQDFMTPRYEGVDRYKDIKCADAKTVKITKHRAVAERLPGSSADNPILCSGDEEIPGPNYPSSWQAASFELTEMVSWSNGSKYKAPKLYIHDSPAFVKYGLDRAYDTNTDLVSAQINVASFRGRLKSKTINFCMEMIRGGDAWTIMMYTWFRVYNRQSKPPRIGNEQLSE